MLMDVSRWSAPWHCTSRTSHQEKPANKLTFFCCQVVSGEVRLRRNHCYYIQVQGQLGVTGLMESFICQKRQSTMFIWYNGPYFVPVKGDYNINFIPISCPSYKLSTQKCPISGAPVASRHIFHKGGPFLTSGEAQWLGEHSNQAKWRDAFR